MRAIDQTVWSEKWPNSTSDPCQMNSGAAAEIETQAAKPQRSRELTHICSVKRTHLRSRRCWNRMTAQYGNVRLTLVGSRLG